MDWNFVFNGVVDVFILFAICFLLWKVDRLEFAKEVDDIEKRLRALEGKE